MSGEARDTPATLQNPGLYPRKSSVGEIFAAVANARADHVAICGQNGTWSYRDIEAASNRLARFLEHRGLTHGGRVTLACARRPETVIAELAIMKAGGIVAPLDPATPPGLLTRQRDACRSTFALADAPIDSTWLSLDHFLEDARDQPDAPLEVCVSPDDIAQIMFTSGSTGAPKGVLVPHRGIVRLVRGQTFAVFGPDTTFLAASPLSFDASTLEIWAPLLNGGRVTLVPQSPPSLDDIADAIARFDVNAAWFTSGLFNLLVDHRLDALKPLRLLMAGGDVLSPSHVRRALDALPETRVVNGYGPTENTTFTTCYAFDAKKWRDGPAPIGHPIAHTRVHILDDMLEAVADGEVGTLWAAGDGVAIGYLDLPEETAKRFRPEPGIRTAGAMMYDTGDLVRRRADGAIEFVGRRDRQVKINGHRVEVDAVEALLSAAPGVREAVVVVETLSEGERRLRGFVVPESKHLDLDELRTHLRSVLPAAHVPQIEPLAALPLTPQGKVDRIRLLEPRITAHAPEDAQDIETRIAAIFESVLRTENLPRHINFFDMGGTSLQLVRIHALIQAQFGAVPLPVLFEYPRIDALSRALALRQTTGQTDGREIRPSSSARPPQTASSGYPPDAVAIIGMAGRFPGAPDVTTFWRNIRDGADSISRFDAHEIEDAFTPDVRARREYVAARGVLADADRFDARYFDMQPREAALTDPQHRVFLEIVAAALDDAGYDPFRTADAIGVFAGTSMNTYLLRHVLADRAEIDLFASEYQLGMYGHLMGALADNLATRIAYKLNLKGPAATVQTACSTSLFAVTQAAQALSLGQCRMAIAGGVSITFPQARGYLHLEGAMGSRDGRVRPFDADASGTVFGAGAGAIVLKRIGDAIQDGDQIHAVIRGWGVNNDGSAKPGFTAPSVTGQASAIQAAISVADIDPSTVGLIECHGTATPMGDPIELAALQRAYGPTGRRALGSVKANIGHLDAAAGVAGLIKTALCVRDGVIPALTHFQRPNPDISPRWIRFLCTDRV